MRKKAEVAAARVEYRKNNLGQEQGQLRAQNHFTAISEPVLPTLGQLHRRQQRPTETLTDTVAASRSPSRDRAARARPSADQRLWRACAECPS